MICLRLARQIGKIPSEGHFNSILPRFFKILLKTFAYFTFINLLKVYDSELALFSVYVNSK